MLATEYFKENPFIEGSGFFTLVDGQYGSTGKGLLASVLAEAHPDFDGVITSNAGPNSGHTSYYGDEKIVLRQLPSFAATLARMGKNTRVYMNAGAIIDTKYLIAETVQYHISGGVMVHPQAAVVSRESENNEKTMVDRIGSTGKGTGAALAAKIMRDPKAIAANQHELIEGGKNNVYVGRYDLNYAMDMGMAVFAEVSQGFSLSLNAGGFYPYCTSRDCTVAQAISDAGVHPTFLRKTAMVVRTFPIRVAGNSGPCYADQRELTWEELGQTPELTTVTQKQRRVFTWSRLQFVHALVVNRPNVVFVNFMNYLYEDHEEWLQKNVVSVATNALGYCPTILLGHGPHNHDVEVW